jgi:NAD(P)-dependent dehydrogenase (short-subunit alcohol dehydrogenase family)
LQEIAVVTGSSSGIGYETALLLARSGYYCCATMRNTERAAPLKTIKERENLPLSIFQLDVNSDVSIEKTLSQIEKKFGEIDILINNAGYGLIGSLEDLSLEETRQQFETNFFGSIRLIKRVLPLMRTRKKGVIVNVSSGAGIIGFPCMSAYASAKFGLEGLSESIMYEVLPFGIRIIIIEPGVVKTDFVKNSVTAKRATRKNSPYIDILKKIKKNVNFMQEHATHPADVANVILHAINDDKPQLRYLVGNDIAMVAEAKRNMSEAEFRRIMMQEVLQGV